MASAADHTIELAREAAHHLNRMGEFKRANDVQRLIKSHSVLRAQVRLLCADLRGTARDA